jgi:hypothetical protein
MSAQWIISVSGKTYGPYTVAEMQSFTAEGRLAPHSLVARSGDGKYGPASQDSDLAFLFAALADQHRLDEIPRPFGQGGSLTSEEPSHFLIVADMRSASTTVLEEEICCLGPAYAVMPHTWLLATELSIGSLKNLLVQKMGKLDMLLIVDASHDRLTWSNLGMETETRIRRIWSKQTQPEQSAA